MDGYLDRLAQDAPSEQERRVRKRRLRELLTPLAYAEGGGRHDLCGYAAIPTF
jgi:hypothetical protein